MKMTSRRIWLMVTIAISVIGAASSAIAQDSRQVHQLSVKEAIEFAKKNSIQVKKALEDIRIQEQVNREVTASALPQVNGSFNFTDNIKLPTSLLPGEFFGQPAGTYVPLKFGVQYSSLLGADLTQILFDGQVFVGLKARKSAMDLSRKTAEVTEENVAVSIYKLYYQLLIAQTQVDLYHDNIERFEKLYHDTREIYKNGFAEKLDVDKVSVTLTNLRTDSLKLMTQMNNGYLGLKVLLGMPIKDSLILTDQITEEIVKQDILDTAYKYEDRREFQMLQLGKKLNEFNVQRYKLMALPTVSAFGNYYANAQRNEFKDLATGQWFQQSSIGLRINVPIFDGNRRRAQMEQARSALRKTEYDMEGLQLSIDNDVAASRRRFHDAVLAVDAQHQNMDLATSVFDQTKKKYDQGLGSNTEINQAQTELRAAQTNLYAALYDAVIAKVDYLKATGKIY